MQHSSWKKAKVAPLKQTTIPRLELAAAVLAVHLDKLLKAELQLQLVKSTFWSDSTTVLSYITNTTRIFKTCVANRVSFIQSLSAPANWRHISSKLNPADAASRGKRVDFLLKFKIWINGPDFISQTQSQWPDTVTVSAIQYNDPEVRNEITVNTILVKPDECPTNKLLNYFSKWATLKTAVAWILKFMEILQQQVK